jgi:hypothetical protein
MARSAAMRQGRAAMSHQPLRFSHRRRVPAGVLAVAIVAALGTVMPVAAIPNGWTSPVRAFAVNGAPAHSLAMDGVGAYHIASEGGPSASGIWYVTDSSGHWESTRLTTGNDHSPSIAVEDGIAHIAFVRSNVGIFTATNDSGDWVVTQRHAGADGPPTLGVRSGTQHVVFLTGHRLVHRFGGAGAPDGSWTAETVDGSCCTGRPSLAITSTGGIRVVYPDGTSSHPSGLRLASRGSGGWSSQTIDSHRSSLPTLSLDETNRPHVAYVRRGAGTWYATRSSGGPWGLRQLSPTASGAPDLAYHSGSIAFIYGSGDKLLYATQSGGVIFASTFSGTGHDSRPQLERFQGRAYITFDRAGTSHNGIMTTRQK